MAQLNIHTTPEFEKNLRFYMRKKRLKRKDEALHQALKEAIKLLKQKKKTTDFSNWLGLGLQAPQNLKPKFKNEDELWAQSLNE